jgi:MscS family membrane protein
VRKIAILLAGVVALVFAAANLETLPDYINRLPPAFHNTFLTVHVWQWCFLAVLLGLSVIAGEIGQVVARKLTVLRDKVVPQPMSQHTRRAIGRSAGMLTGSLLAASLLPSVRLSEIGHLVDGHRVASLDGHVESLIQGLIVSSLTMLCYAYWEATCDTLAAKAAGIQRAERLLVPMMRKLVQAVIVVIGIFVILAVFFGTKTLTGLVAGLGVTGLVVALAGKDSIENVFGSLTILFDMPFALGDYVKIDKVEGSVEEINLRSTRIRTIEDTLITLPNANLIRASVENFGARRLRRQKMSLRLSYATEPRAIESLCNKLRAFLNEQEEIEAEKTQVQLDEASETSIGITVIWFLHTASALQEAQSRSRLLEEALRLKKLPGLYFASNPTPESEKN